MIENEDFHGFKFLVLNIANIFQLETVLTVSMMNWSFVAFCYMKFKATFNAYVVS